MNKSFIANWIYLLEDEDIRKEIRKSCGPILNILMDELSPYLYLIIFILMFLLLSSVTILIILGMVFQSLRKKEIVDLNFSLLYT